MLFSKFNHSHILRIIRILALVVLFIITPKSIIEASSTKSKITGEPEALKIFEEFKSYESSSLPISGVFIHELHYLEAISIKNAHGEDEIIEPAGKHTQRIEYAIQEDCIRFSNEKSNDRGFSDVPKYVTAWDGTKGQMYIAKDQMANLYANKDDLLEESHTLDPRGFSLFINTIGASMDIEGGELEVSRKLKDGEDLVVITQKAPFRTFEYWLDPENKLIPKQIIEYYKNSDDIRTETIIHNYTIRDDGTWFITKSTTTFPKEKRKCLFNTEKVSFEEIPLDFFNIDIPDNTLVYDKASGLRFIAGGDIPIATDIDAIIDESLSSDTPTYSKPPIEEDVISFNTSDVNQENSSVQIEINKDETILKNLGQNDLIVVHKTPYLHIFVAAFFVTILLGICYIIVSRSYRKSN